MLEMMGRGLSTRGLMKALWLVVASVTAAGCGPHTGGSSPEEPLDVLSLYGRFSTSSPLTVAPDRFWETDKKLEHWQFRGYAGLLCVVNHELEENPRFLLEVDEATARFHFMVRWDGEDLWPEPRTMEPGGELVEVPLARAEPGVHRLSVDRMAAADRPGDRGSHTNRFSRVAYAVGGGQWTVLEPTAADRVELIRAFIEDGVTGSGYQRYGGWLVEGELSTTARLRLEEASTLSFDVLSIDGSQGRFTAAAAGGGREVAATAEAQLLELDLEPGDHEIRFEVAGDRRGLYLWAAPRLRPQDRDSRGPVVLVTMDTTRRDALSVYGGPAEASPNIQRLAENATVFDNAWASSPWTLPSHASLFTGKHPSQHGAGVTKPRLSSGVLTLAKVFREAGYRTVGFAGGEMSASHWGVAQGFESFYNPEGFETRGDRLDELMQPVLRDSRMEPLFLFVNYFDPHALYAAPARHRSLFQVDELSRRLGSLQPWKDLADGQNSAFREIVYSEVEVPDAALDYLRAAYLAEVAFMDQQIGRLVRTLRQRGLFDDATIVLVADHGEFLGEDGFFSHGCRLDPELTHVPLIVKWPHQRGSERVEALASHVDILPTLVEAAALQPVMTEGLTLATGARRQLERRQAVFMEEHDNRIHPLIERMAIAPNLFGIQRTADREVVWRGGSTCERWTAAGWAAEPCADSWEERLAQLEHFAAAADEVSAEGSEESLSGEMRERLEALGYIR